MHAADAVQCHAEAGVLTITLNRPKANAINVPTSLALYAAFARLQDDPALRVGIITGTGRFFSAGWDLAAATEHLPHRVSGEAVLEIDRITWSRGRIEACEGRCAVSRGRVGQRLLDALVTVLGCRPGPAYRSLTRDEVRSFDDVSCGLRIEASGVHLTAGSGRGGALMRVQGLSVIEEPVAGMPLERLAWLASPPGAAPVPASRATAWLLGLLPLDEPGATSIGGGVGGDARGGASSQAIRPLQRSEF
jgi:hypothetical protein